MASESQLLNGMSSEAVAVTLEAMLGMGVGIGVSFYYYWKISLVTIACAPLLIISTFMN